MVVWSSSLSCRTAQSGHGKRNTSSRSIRINFGQLDESVKGALASQPRLERYTFCLPYDRPAGASGESAMRRWRTHQETWQGWEREAGRGNVDFQYKGESDLLSLLTQEQHAGRAFYWFDATVLSRDWFKAHLDEALAHAGPRYTPAFEHRTARLIHL